MRIIVNAIIMALELAAIAGVAALGFMYPYIFAALTAVIAMGLGSYLDYARLRHEYPFYFGHEAPRYFFFLRAVAATDTLIKGLVAGLVALLTFSGTNQDRLFWVAIGFAATLYAGTNILRWLAMGLQARPSRWGFFRLAVPLGLLFSSVLAVFVAFNVLSAPTIAEIGRQIVFDMPQKPGIEHVSELLFNLKQYIDSVVVTLLSAIIPPDWARLASVVISVNVLTGFVTAVYAVVIAEAVAWAERGNS